MIRDDRNATTHASQRRVRFFVDAPQCRRVKSPHVKSPPRHILFCRYVDRTAPSQPGEPLQIFVAILIFAIFVATAKNNRYFVVPGDPVRYRACVDRKTPCVRGVDDATKGVYAMTAIRPWIGSVPKRCDFCGIERDSLRHEFFDVRSHGGTWGIACAECFYAPSSRFRLGTGLGQHFKLNPNTDAFEKVRG